MRGRFGWTVAVAWSVAALAAGSAARAEESVSVLGTNPAATCATAAAEAVGQGVPAKSALAACDEAIRQAPLTRGERAATYLNRGVLHLAAGDYPAAIADDDAALRLQGDLAEAFINRGAAFSAQRRFGDAVGDFTRALAMAPRQPAQIYYNRALAREDLGDVKGAYLDYLQASRLAPGWDRPKAELARFTVARPAQG
jgi:tetratricopeptide (TPR) repeat protein